MGSHKQMSHKQMTATSIFLTSKENCKQMTSQAMVTTSFCPTSIWPQGKGTSACTTSKCKTSKYPVTEKSCKRLQKNLSTKKVSVGWWLKKASKVCSVKTPTYKLTTGHTDRLKRPPFPNSAWKTCFRGSENRVDTRGKGLKHLFTFVKLLEKSFAK